LTCSADDRNDDDKMNNWSSSMSFTKSFTHIFTNLCITHNFIFFYIKYFSFFSMPFWVLSQIISHIMIDYLWSQLPCHCLLS
jgi:hypothetical protein